MLNEL
jgi:RNA recognition motif-containing protein